MNRRNQHHQHLRGPHGHGRRRARRGTVGSAILMLLDEQPMHGYELIGALDERSGGRWKPSPGSIYPALQRLEARGFIAPVSDADDDGKRRFELTDSGRQRLADRGDEPAPWDAESLGRGGELRRSLAELVGPTKQIGRFGSPEQVEAAAEVLKDTTTKLYRILADGAPTDDA